MSSHVGVTRAFLGMPEPLPKFPDAAREALTDSVQRRNLAHATGLIRAKRAEVVGELDNWEELRRAAEAIKNAALHRLDERPRRDLARRPSSHELRQLAAEVDELLGEDGSGEEPVVGLRGRPDDAHALAVVASARRLHGRCAAVGVQEVREHRPVAHLGPGGNRDSQGAEPATHDQLVLGDAEGVGAGPHRHPRGDQRGEHLLRHVLVVEGDHVDISREGEHRRGVPVVAHRGRGEGGRGVRRLGEHAEVDAQSDRRGDHHARQLAAADDAHHRSHGIQPIRGAYRPAASG